MTFVSLFLLEFCTHRQMKSFISLSGNLFILFVPPNKRIRKALPTYPDDWWPVPNSLSKEGCLLLAYLSLAVTVKLDSSLFSSTLHDSSTPSLEEALEWPPSTAQSAAAHLPFPAGVAQVSHRRQIRNGSPVLPLCPTKSNMEMFHSEASKPRTLKANERRSYCLS